jgi:ureidoacrylate peracid hydrolase
VITVLKQVLHNSRQAGVQVVYLHMAYDAKLANRGGPESPNWHQEVALLLMGKRPEMKGEVLTEGYWDWEVVRGIKTICFTGIATNVRVESTLRDALFLDYWPLLRRDATMQAGPPNLQEATKTSRCFLAGL